MCTECVGVSGKILKHSRMHPLLCDELAKFVTYIGEIMVLLHNRRKYQSGSHTHWQLSIVRQTPCMAPAIRMDIMVYKNCAKYEKMCKV